MSIATGTRTRTKNRPSTGTRSASTECRKSRGMGNLWSRGVARSSIMGYEKTSNPTPAAYMLLGKKRVRAAKRVLKKRGRRRAHRGNPLPAVVGVLSGLGGIAGKLGGRFRKPSEARAGGVAESVVQAANAGNLTAARGLIERAAKPMLAKESAVWKAAAARLSAEIIAAVRRNADRIPQADQSSPEAFAASVLANPVTAAGPAAVGGAGPAGGVPSAVEQVVGALAQPGTIRTIARAAAPRRSRRQRYPTYTDRYGRQRYSTKPPGTDLRIPAGATPSPGTPYSFFRGAVGKGGAAATAGQVAVAAAAGVAADLVTQRVLQYLGGRAQAKEEAGVNAALAFRQARKDFETQQGRPPNRTELKEMGDAYKAQLLELGYDPVTFTRTRGRVAQFLEDYNPLGG